MERRKARFNQNPNSKEVRRVNPNPIKSDLTNSNSNPDRRYGESPFRKRERDHEIHPPLRMKVRQLWFGLDFRFGLRVMSGVTSDDTG